MTTVTIGLLCLLLCCVHLQTAALKIVDTVKVRRQHTTRLGMQNLFNNKRASGSANNRTDTVKKYFEYWNQRDMKSATNLFDPKCVYEDTLYPGAFEGKEKVEEHLYRVANAVPSSFKFVVDFISEDTTSGNVGVQWHVESENKELPFTRGCSMYVVGKNGLIMRGFDVPEPVVKPGSINLGILSFVSKLLAEPPRTIPLLAWGFYCWFLFLSTEAPGLNALAIDPATWKEVRDLSLNFWLVLPVLSPGSSPALHPIVEAVFNLVLAWGLLFAGFMADGVVLSNRTGKKTEQKFLPVAIGAQFLTNAILLPYLFTRSSQQQTPQLYFEDLGPVEKAAESKALPIVAGLIGSLAIFWAVLGRPDMFADVSSRIDSYVDFVGHDRLSFSLLVDLVYFAAFQGWLVDDDVRRRQATVGNNPAALDRIKAAAKFVPFFGLVAYMLQRPSLPSKQNP